MVRVMGRLSEENMEVLRLFIITAAIIIAVLTSVFSLLNGIVTVFPFHFILPIILVVYFYPERGVSAALGLGLMYIGLIYLLGNSDAYVIAGATAWFAIFIAIGVVTSSYALKLRREAGRVRSILGTSHDGIFCIGTADQVIRDINVKCARWLGYERTDLLGAPLSRIWADETDRNGFIADLRSGTSRFEREVHLVGRDETVVRAVISPLLVTQGYLLCSVVNTTSTRIVDEEIIETLNALDAQVMARTADLERINERLRAEILECRRIETMILSGRHDLPGREEP